MPTIYAVIQIKTDIDTRPACILSWNSASPENHDFNTHAFPRSIHRINHTSARHGRTCVEVEHVGGMMEMKILMSAPDNSWADLIFGTQRQLLGANVVSDRCCGLRTSATEYEWILFLDVEVDPGPKNVGWTRVEALEDLHGQGVV